MTERPNWCWSKDKRCYPEDCVAEDRCWHDAAEEEERIREEAS